MAAPTSVPPPPKSWAGPVSETTTSAGLPVRKRVTLAAAGEARVTLARSRGSTIFFIFDLLGLEHSAQLAGDDGPAVRADEDTAAPRQGGNEVDLGAIEADDVEPVDLLPAVAAEDRLFETVEGGEGAPPVGQAALERDVDLLGILRAPGLAGAFLRLVVHGNRSALCRRSAGPSSRLPARRLRRRDENERPQLAAPPEGDGGEIEILAVGADRAEPQGEPVAGRSGEDEEQPLGGRRQGDLGELLLERLVAAGDQGEVLLRYRLDHQVLGQIPLQVPVPGVEEALGT